MSPHAWHQSGSDARVGVSAVAELLTVVMSREPSDNNTLFSLEDEGFRLTSSFPSTHDTMQGGNPSSSTDGPGLGSRARPYLIFYTLRL